MWTKWHPWLVIQPVSSAETLSRDGRGGGPQSRLWFGGGGFLTADRRRGWEGGSGNGVTVRWWGHRLGHKWTTSDGRGRSWRGVGGRRRADGTTRTEAVGRARLDATETGLRM
jgi:hypothetical protein